MKSLLEIYFDWQNKNPWQAWKELKSVRLLLPLLFGMCGFFIVWEYGPLISLLGDGYNYLLGSYSVERFIGTMRYAPLYSALLSVPQVFGVSLINSVSVVGALGYGILVFCFASMLLKHTRYFFIFFLGVLSLLVHFYMAERFALALSDALFATFCMVFLFGLFQVIEKPTYQKVFLLGVFASLCALKRYVGIIAIAFGGVVILFFLNKTAFFTRIKYSVLFGLTASTPLFLWLMKNLYFTGTLTGKRSVMYTSLFLETSKAFSQLMKFIDLYYLYFVLPFIREFYTVLHNLSWPLFLVIVFALIVSSLGVIQFFIKVFHHQRQAALEAPRGQQISYMTISLLFFFPLAYWVYLSTLRAFFHFDTLISFRFSMPTVAPLWLFFLIILDRVWHQGIHVKSAIALKSIFTLGAIFVMSMAPVN